MMKNDNVLIQSQSSLSFRQLKEQWGNLLDENQNLSLGHTDDGTFVELFMKIKMIKPELSPHTIRAYNQDLKTVLTFFKELDVSLKEIGFMEVKAFNHWMNQTYAKRSAARKLEFFRRMLTFGHETHFYSALYTTWIEKPTVSKGHYSEKKQVNRTEYRELSTREAELIVKALEDTVKHSMLKEEYQARNRLIGMLLYLSGMRSSEVLSLNWGSFREDRRGNMLVDVFGKGKKERTIPVFKDVQNALFHYRESLGESTMLNPSDETPLFFQLKPFVKTGVKKRLSYTTLYRLIKTAVYAIQGNSSISPHWFRHTFITNSLANDVPLSVVKQVVGHASIATTNIYLEKLQEDTVYDAFRNSGYR
ncbi:tyrosine-type recombinase/integrase [Priestia flexa]|jgi:integrase/recombinase XerD|nr:tyrosine-type recombinase/integrase [Priestia flexa]MCA0966792.1 tyrosine-type recombinase/integrase [Priestia flexa]MCG7312677.1 tyrosine-type recombinase/integrase [Priestia flexa]MCP1189285.1 tyrosine-type recombinase/integrase [Priestia flexa]MED4590187.1 tyrosine-type recombinase/integrase [Priestia flexa]UIR31781.1 tyrosine-type recombinase/integrase [Priestia flexa]